MLSICRLSDICLGSYDCNCNLCRENKTPTTDAVTVISIAITLINKEPEAAKTGLTNVRCSTLSLSVLLALLLIPLSTSVSCGSLRMITASPQQQQQLRLWQRLPLSDVEQQKQANPPGRNRRNRFLFPAFNKHLLQWNNETVPGRHCCLCYFILHRRPQFTLQPAFVLTGFVIQLRRATPRLISLRFHVWRYFALCHSCSLLLLLQQLVRSVAFCIPCSKSLLIVDATIATGRVKGRVRFYIVF